MLCGSSDMVEWPLHWDSVTSGDITTIVFEAKYTRPPFCEQPHPYLPLLGTFVYVSIVLSRSHVLYAVHVLVCVCACKLWTCIAPLPWKVGFLFQVHSFSPHSWFREMYEYTLVKSNFIYCIIAFLIRIGHLLTQAKHIVALLVRFMEKIWNHWISLIMQLFGIAFLLFLI